MIGSINRGPRGPGELDELHGSFSTTGSAKAEGAKDILRSKMHVITDLIDNVFNNVSSLVDQLQKEAKAFDSELDRLVQKDKPLRKKMKDVLKSTVSFRRTRLDKVKDFLSNVMDKIKAFFKEALKELGDFIDSP